LIVEVHLGGQLVQVFLGSLEICLIYLKICDEVFYGLSEVFNELKEIDELVV